MSTVPPVTSPIRRRDDHRSIAWLAIAVGIGTLAVSVVALSSPALMQLMTRDLAKLRSGQWWRSITPVVVQPDGWGQLAFNVLGILIVGAALQHRTNLAAWILIYLLGGVGGVAAIGVWHPADQGGGSSDAVAALIGALTVLLAAHDDYDRGRAWATSTAQVYCVFFAGYLTALDLGGVWWSIFAGNTTIAAYFVARRALSAATLNRACLLLVGAAGVIMTAQQDGHGFGIIAGVCIALFILLQRRVIVTWRTRGPQSTSDELDAKARRRRARSRTGRRFGR